MEASDPLTFVAGVSVAILALLALSGMLYLIPLVVRGWRAAMYRAAMKIVERQEADRGR